ncbi:receptor kinase-like protein Xa21 [Ipomoea triloba]|uniref:receptor kinase-like protein Xa21 n=1 Tax=Ipomoea triloba TaxID=35885 RepID=UPI00125D8E23|nr:receptor kinase-like protein Xa21 [Ipomoea triloba]
MLTNKINGNIPTSIGECSSLKVMYMSRNQLNGPLPREIENLTMLKILNLGVNALSSGEIPKGLGNLDELEKLLLNHNELSGSISWEIFNVSWLRALSLASNHNLLARFSYYELQRATNGFDQSNSLGSGSFGCVYKGVLTNGMHVAVKSVKNRSGQPDSHHEVLRHNRHRNLTKVLGSCSNLDFEALVLEYMSNGSLHKWLYSHNYFLDMIQRVSIVIDVASALEYFHFDYSEPIIHCDLKPNNVLIDVDIVGHLSDYSEPIIHCDLKPSNVLIDVDIVVGHLSDFGAAKLLGDENSIAITNTLTTIGYIAPAKSPHDRITIKDALPALQKIKVQLLSLFA